jgi:hypothetical protein
MIYCSWIWGGAIAFVLDPVEPDFDVLPACEDSEKKDVQLGGDARGRAGMVRV